VSRGALAYSAEGVRRAASVVAGFAPAIWAYSLNHVLTRAFYAAGDTRTPMKISLAIVSLNFALNLTLIWFIREAGLAWSTSVCAALQCVILTVLGARNLGIRVFDRTTARGVARAAAATAIMATGVWAVLESLPDPLLWRDHAFRAAAGSGAGIAIYVVASIALRVPEIRWLLRRRADGA
jgi:putative peptidoglycan lipid II flippase